jgi:Rab GDP dissociation inhibitor
LDYAAIDGTYVLQNKEGGFFSKGGLKIFKVPVTPKEALSSDLMGLFEKRRCQKFLEAIQNFEEKNPKTHEGIKLNSPGKEMLAKYELEDNTIDFIGHAVALYTNDSFMNRPAVELIRKIQLYMDSMGKNPSPFIYPIFGLGGIPEGFSRISAVNGGTFMLNTDITEVLYENGKVVGVKGPDGIAKCSTLICDPTYALRCGLKNRVNLVEKIIRCICILDHPIPGTENLPSVQIILPQRQLKRKNGTSLPTQTSTS